MKHLLLYLLMIGAAFAADTKTALPKERPLTKEEALAFDVDYLRLARLQEKYKVSEYQEQANPIFTSRQERFMAVCRSIGIPEDKIATECRFTTGVDENGKPQIGQDGKPVEPRVWREEAKEKK